MDRTGKFAFDGDWTNAWSFHEGRALVRPTKNYGFIDVHGRLVIPAKYYDAWIFSGGLAHVSENNNETGLWGYIDSTGAAVFQSKRISATFHDGLARVQVFNPAINWPLGSFGFVDRTGSPAIPATLEWAEEFSEGLAPFATGGNHEAVRRLKAD